MVRKPLMGPRFGHYWHVLQTASAAEIAFNRQVRLFPKSSWSELWAKKPNESEKTVFLTGHREVTYKSGKEYNNLRTETLHGAIIDECREQSPELWPMVIRPMLAKHKGWCDFYTTPAGYDWLFDLYQSALLNPEEWGTFHAPSTEAWWWTPEEIESARREMTEAMFAQEILAEFRDITSGKAYLNFGTHNYKSQNPFTASGQRWTPYLPIVVGMDFNVNHMSWHLGQRKASQIWFGDRIYFEQNSSTQEAALELVQKVRDHKLGVTLIGDASGKAQSTKSAGKSDYDIIHTILRDNNIPYQDLTPDSNPLVKDRINTMNVRAKSSTGHTDFFFDPKVCKELDRDFQRVVWKKGSQATLDKTTDVRLTHPSDSVGYPVCVLLPLEGVNEIGKMRIINRG